MALFGEELFERDVVFDHAVVNQGDRARVVGVRMGIGLRRGAVGRPARVGHAEMGCGKGSPWLRALSRTLILPTARRMCSL